MKQRPFYENIYTTLFTFKKSFEGNYTIKIWIRMINLVWFNKKNLESRINISEQFCLEM